MAKKTAQWQDGVGKRCGERTGEKKCKTSPNCGPDHTWWIKVQWKGDRKSGYGPASKFIDVGLWRDHQLPPQTRKEAKMLAAEVLHWLQQGKPMPEKPKATTGEPELTINNLLDKFFKKQIRRKLTNPGSRNAFDSKVKVTRDYFGKLPISALEQGDCLGEFMQQYLDAGRKIGTPNAILASVLRPATKWGAAQRPPLVKSDPFGRYLFKINRGLETKRKRRVTPHEEAHMLDACGILDDPIYDRCGRTLSDFIILAIDTGGRTFELLSLKNEDIDWHAHLIGFYDTKFDNETRLVPFNPTGRVAEILKRRRFAGPKAHVIIDADGEAVKKVYRAWVHAACIAFNIPFEQTGSGGRPTDETIAGYMALNKFTPHALRHETRTWLGLCGVPDDEADFIAGHARQTIRGNYKHELLHRVTRELREKVWPRENERAVFDKKERQVAG